MTPLENEHASTANRFRAKAKSILPQAILKQVRKARTYLLRLNIWISVIRNVKGERYVDRRRLWLSFFASPFTAAQQLGEWKDPVLLKTATVRVKGAIFVLRPRCDDLFHVLPSRERAIFSIIQTSLKDGDCFVDAGANLGFYTVLASRRVGPSGKVIAVEMMPETASVLRSHLRLNAVNNVHVVENALSDTAGEEITASVPDGKSGQASIRGGVRGRSVTVRTTTLDNILNGVPSVSLLKMDLEGAEELALRGAAASLARVSTVIFESARNDTPSRLILEQHGFAVRRLDGRNFVGTRRGAVNDAARLADLFE